MTDPVWLVAVPLVASVLPVALGPVGERDGWWVAFAAVAAQFALAVETVLRVVAAAAGGPPAAAPVASNVGGVPAPFGIRLVVDAFSAPFVALVPAAGLVVLAYTRRAGPRSGPFHSLVLLLVAGLTGVCVTADVFNLYVFLEISGLAAYALVATEDSGAAAVAAFRYLLVGTVGASLYLFGVAYAYVATGTLSVAALARQLGGADPALAVAAFGLMAVGLGVKIALYPLHTWKPDAYAAAPAGVAALLAALVSTVAAYALGRLLLSAFTVAFVARFPSVETVLLLAAGASILSGSALALRSEEVARLLAYSSVAQFGVVLVGFGVATPTGVAGSVVHLVGHAAMKAGAFLSAGVLAATCGAETVEEYAGLASREPYASAAVAVFALGLVGIPPTVGFAGKFYVAAGAVEAGAWWAAGLVLLSTLFSLTYFGRLLERMYVRDPPAEAIPTGRGSPESASTGMYASVAVAVLATLALGFGAALLEESLVPFLEAVL